jgi:RNA polymerase sigma-70 factor (ECF subfamily)
MLSGTVGSELCRVFRGGIAVGLDDRELLEQFAAERNQAGEIAFAALVARHGPMVLGVCRRMLRNPADAEDAFQATFLILVRKAVSIRVGDSLGPWLYGVTVRVARRLRDVSARRSLVELDTETIESTHSWPRGPDHDLRITIDEALARLPERYRAPIVLCHLQGLTHDEAAGRLRCPVGTVRSRLARGRALLRNRLERSAVCPLAAASDWFQLDHGRFALARQLVRGTASSAARCAARQPLAEIVSPTVAQIVTGVAKTMTISKLALAVSLMILAGIAAWGASGLAAQSQDAAPPRSGPVVGPKAVRPGLVARNEGAELLQKTRARGQAKAAAANAAFFADLPPVVVAIEPAVGAADVDPGLSEIRVTFSKDMKPNSWSWTEGTQYAVPKLSGKIHYEPDKRTCVMPVKLEPGKTYVLGINSESFRNFQDTGGRPALNYLVAFRTRDAR